MGNENHHHNHLQFYHQKTMFLPILCSRPSIKDVNLPRCRGLQNSTIDDPLSPKIGCMGQVKRNNKIAGVPTSSHSSNRLSLTAAKSTTPVVKYSKLKKLFSGKNFSISTPTTTTAVSNSNIIRCGTRQQQVAEGNSSAGLAKHSRCGTRSDQNQNQNLVAISIEEMDPPLPVIKKVPNLEEGSSKVENSLWKRRKSGPDLKGLQLQQIHHPRICPQLDPTTV